MASTIELLHKASGSRMTVGKAAFDAGEYPAAEYDVIARHITDPPRKRKTAPKSAAKGKAEKEANGADRS